MLYLILVVLFSAVFTYIGWLIWKRPTPPVQEDRFVCPNCNAYDCECHKKQD